MVLFFLTTSTVINYLSKSDYGIWATIYSILAWVYLLDFGFSNVIKTKLPVTIVEQDFKKSNELINTIYIGISLISIVLFFLFLISNLIISPSVFFKLELSSINFNLLLLINVLFSITNLIIGNHKSLFVGVLKTHFVEFSLMLVQLIIFILIISISKFSLFSNYPKILIISLVYGLVNILVNVFFTFYFFKKNKNFKISNKFFNPSILKESAHLGIKYFVIQVCMIIIYSTDHFLILKYFGSTEVANFDIVYKLFQVPMLLLTAGLSPFWSIFSKAFAEKRYLWIKKVLINYNYLFILFVIGIVLLNYFLTDIVYLWINKSVQLPSSSILAISIYVIMISYVSIYSFFLNGINNINLSMYVIMIQAIINIPLCLFFIKNDYGITGIIIGNCLSIIPATLISPTQSFYIITKKIKGFTTQAVQSY